MKQKCTRSVGYVVNPEFTKTWLKEKSLPVPAHGHSVAVPSLSGCEIIFGKTSEYKVGKEMAMLAVTAARCNDTQIDAIIHLDEVMRAINSVPSATFDNANFLSQQILGSVSGNISLALMFHGNK